MSFEFDGEKYKKASAQKKEKRIKRSNHEKKDDLGCWPQNYGSGLFHFIYLILDASKDKYSRDIKYSRVVFNRAVFDSYLYGHHHACNG